MTHDDLLREFGTASRAAVALGVTRAVVSIWKRRGIPVMRQVKIQHQTRGRLKAELPKYNGRTA